MFVAALLLLCVNRVIWFMIETKKKIKTKELTPMEHPQQSTNRPLCLHMSAHGISRNVQHPFQALLNHLQLNYYILSINKNKIKLYCYGNGSTEKEDT